MSSSACRLCGSAELARHLDVRGCTLDRCAGCGFVQVRDRPSEETLRAIYGDGYFAKGKYTDEVAQRRENQRRLDLLAAAGTPAGGRVLDVGCATGEFIEAAGPRYEMWGLDVSPFATAQARERNPAAAERIYTGFIEDQPFAPASFDAIVLWDVVEHLWDPRAVLRALVGFLRPGGALILSTPDIGALTARLMGGRWAFMTPPEHLGFFSDGSLTWLLERDLGLRTTSASSSGKWANVGFIVYKLGRVFPGLVPAPLLERLRGTRLGRTALYVPTADVRYVAARKPEA